MAGYSRVAGSILILYHQIEFFAIDDFFWITPTIP